MSDTQFQTEVFFIGRRGGGGGLVVLFKVEDSDSAQQQEEEEEVREVEEQTELERSYGSAAHLH